MIDKELMRKLEIDSFLLNPNVLLFFLLMCSSGPADALFLSFISAGPREEHKRKNEKKLLDEALFLGYEPRHEALLFTAQDSGGSQRFISFI